MRRPRPRTAASPPAARRADRARVVIVPKFAAPGDAVRRAEVRRVQQVEDLGAELDRAGRRAAAPAASARGRRRDTTARAPDCATPMPSVNCGAIGERRGVEPLRSASADPAGSVGSPTRFGRCTPKPAKALKLVVCVTATGTPDCSVTSAVDRPVVDERAEHAVQLSWRGPRPTGRSQTTDETKTCGMSPVE